MDVLLSIEQAAQRLGGVSKWTVHSWLSKGKLPRTKIGARTMIRERICSNRLSNSDATPGPCHRITANGPGKDAAHCLVPLHRVSGDGSFDVGRGAVLRSHTVGI